MAPSLDDRDSDRRVLRAGDTVRRPIGYWTPAVHALLNHLESVGFEDVPRVVGVDEESEVVTFVEGQTPTRGASDWSEWAGEEILFSVGALLRRYHDAAASFDPPAWARWQATSGPTSGKLVCHNDLYPGNVVFRDGAPVGIIDFDFAHPADPLWDVVVAAWHWVPLSVELMGEQVPESAWPLRLRLFLDGYGVAPDQRPDILPIVADLTRRMRANRERDGHPTERFDLSLAALGRQWAALLDAVT